MKKRKWGIIGLSIILSALVAFSIIMAAQVCLFPLCVISNNISEIPAMLFAEGEESEFSQKDIDFITSYVGDHIDIHDVLSMGGSRLYGRTMTIYWRMTLTGEKSTEMYEKLAQKDGWERGPLPSGREVLLLSNNWPELGNITEKNDILWHYEEGEAEGNSWCAILDEEEDTLHFELSYDREKGSG